MDNNLLDELSELEQTFSLDNSEMDRMEKQVLSQNLEGFASCFPEWDLHPPVRR